MDITRGNLAAVFVGIQTLWDTSFQGAAPEWNKIAMKTTSKSASEIYSWLGAVPGMKKLVGESTIQNLSQSNFSIVNEEFDSTVGIKRSDIERDSIGTFTPVVQSLGIAAAQHPDELVGDALSAGFTTKDYTGVNFYGTNKPHEPDNKKSSKFSNKGTAALSGASFGVAKANIKGRKNAKNRSMKLGKKLLLIVPPTLEDTARKILKADTIDGGDTNIQKDTAELHVCADLATDTEWHLIDSGLPVKPIIFQEEVATEFNSQTDPGSDHVFLKKEYLFQAYGRYAVGYGLPQLAYGSTGAA